MNNEGKTDLLQGSLSLQYEMRDNVEGGGGGGGGGGNFKITLFLTKTFVMGTFEHPKHYV